MKRAFSTVLSIFLLAFSLSALAQHNHSRTESFNKGWKFFLGDPSGASDPAFDDHLWRLLDLPHDWSIELPFDIESPTGTGGGALRGGTGWYRKTFTPGPADKDRQIAISFDGIYRNSEVWINGKFLGKRPNGYITFEYDITPYLRFGDGPNVIAVKVDNSEQPNSRWYSGSGIYRNVWLTRTAKMHIAKWGVHIKTSLENSAHPRVTIATAIANPGYPYSIRQTVYDAGGAIVANRQQNAGNTGNVTIDLSLSKPHLWSIHDPYLYKVVTQLIAGGKVIDEVTTPFGIRYFRFDPEKGFFLNGEAVKIIGVCNHHDLGCLGTAVNTRAIERQLEIMKGMGINGIRTSHNPPAPELLDLCDRMGFIVMDEAFDMWKIEKTKYDYHLDFEEWHKRDLTDQVLRDRNHPSIFMWSVGNEIIEQWTKEPDTSGKAILRNLYSIVKSLDDRPVLTANNGPDIWNRLLQANISDILGYNYSHHAWSADSVKKRWGVKPFIVTESVSALQTRGSYDMPSDSIRRWPKRWDIPLENANDDLSCSAYENCSTPWGSTHEETLRPLLANGNISGMFVWTGFDYIGEPTPYPWPARSSYFGIIDLAGFPKDAYYLYQSLFTKKNVLHLFPHWNWKPGQAIDMWAYYNNADEVELLINGKSQGTRKKTGDDLHVMWRVFFEEGIVKAVSKKNGKIVMTKEIRTAGAPARIVLAADRNAIRADGADLSFVTAKVVDRDGNLVPGADNLLRFSLSGPASIAGTDNGLQTDLTSFQSPERKAFHGLCLAVVRAKLEAGSIRLTAEAEGLPPATVIIQSK